MENNQDWRIIGVNRTVSHNDIASGIRSGILDSILFTKIM